MRTLCKECGVDSNGSKVDLILCLRTEMQNRQAYDKVFEKIWGASGESFAFFGFVIFTLSLVIAINKY